MPVRSLRSPVLKWPDAGRVAAAARAWAGTAAGSRPEVQRIGYFGSYARGDWGVGSDLDIVVIVDQAAAPFHARPLEWDLHSLPVPADILIYTAPEWRSLAGAFQERLAREVVWVFERGR